jgi:AcrR family transcriptional regulator
MNEDHVITPELTKVDRRKTQIIEAALDLLSEKSLTELSLRDIAKKLAIKAPALYWYFKSKSELVDYMAEAILKKGFADAQPRADDEPWQDWLIAYMHRLRKAMLAYPDGGRVVSGAHLYPVRSLAQIFENLALSLMSAGLDEQTTALIIMTTVHFTFGFVIEEQSGPSDEDVAAFTEAHHRNFSTNYPNFTHAFEQYMSGDTTSDRSYDAALRLIIRGAQV